MSARLERLAAACLLASFEGPAAPDWIRRSLEGGLGGVVLFASNVRDRPQLAGLTAVLRESGDVLIGIDEEGGDVTRLDGVEGSSYPGNAALGVVDDVALTERVARSIGAELAAAGVNLDFAPVADVNVNPANPVIGIRAFGSEPALVARHVAAFVRGLQAQGVAACAKHFPGHGDTELDSHLELPTVGGDIEGALVPFRAAVDAGVRTVMTAHIRVTGYGDAPATINPVLLGRLRDELGFDGLVIADALEMKGLSATVGVVEGAVRAVEAGADALIVGRDLGEDWVTEVQRALVGAVESGRLSEARLAEAAGRVRREAAAATPIAGEVDLEAGRVAARRALLVDGDPSVGETARVVELRSAANVAAGRARHTFSPDTIVVPEGEPLPAGPDVIVVRDAHRHAWMRDAVAAHPDAVVVELGLPLWRPERARGYVAAYGGGRVNLEEAAGRVLAAGPR